MRLGSVVVSLMVGAWSALSFSGAALAQVEIPEGFEVVEIFRSERLSGYPDINDCGEIVFDSQMGPDQQDREIFLYDNGKLRRITENPWRDLAPRINGHGEIVWARTVDPPDDDEIILWRAGGEILLDSSVRKPLKMVHAPVINNQGWVAWGRGDRTRYGCKGDIVLWDTVETRKISQRDRLWDQSPDINSRGDVVWEADNVCVNPWVSEIHMYSDGRVTVLPSSFEQLQVPSINDIGQVAWTGIPAVEFWEDGQTRLLTDDGRAPDINNRGDVYFYRWYENLQVWQPWLVDGKSGKFYRLVDDAQTSYSAGRLNDWGEAVWWRSRGPVDRRYGILVLRRIRTGDSEFDGAIDLSDYKAVAECMTGPGQADRLCDCRFLDIDYDGDVDLGDFARFQNAFQGP